MYHHNSNIKITNMKYTLLLILLVLTLTIQAQSNESVGIFTPKYHKETNYDIVHTDRTGVVVWRIPSYSNELELNDNVYSICGYTKIKNNKITSNPDDYDYWLVDKEIILKTDISPNPAINNVTITIDKLVDDLQASLYSIYGVLILNYTITEYYTTLNLPKLSNGMYFIKIHASNKPFKIYKLCVLQNSSY
jgi:hypothetical protein